MSNEKNQTRDYAKVQNTESLNARDREAQAKKAQSGSRAEKQPESRRADREDS